MSYAYMILLQSTYLLIMIIVSYIYMNYRQGTTRIYIYDYYINIKYTYMCCAYYLVFTDICVGKRHIFKRGKTFCFSISFVIACIYIDRPASTQRARVYVTVTRSWQIPIKANNIVNCAQVIMSECIYSLPFCITERWPRKGWGTIVNKGMVLILLIFINSCLGQ